MNRCLVVFVSLVLLVIGCNNDKENENNEIEGSQVVSLVEKNLKTPVKTLLIKKRDFNRELFANGKLNAMQKANLNFRSPGIITSIHVAEGARVHKGQVIATLDQIQQEREYRQAQLKHKQALLDYQDQLLRAGYQLQDTATLNKEVLDIARLRSGLSNAEFDIQRIQIEKENTVLIAPFAGKIANVKAYPHSSSSAFEYVCTLIDDSQLEVEFQVMEQELEFIRSSKTIRLQSFSGDGQLYAGTISSINPLVDQSGMITIKARLSNRDNQLMDGMSVRVIIEKAIPTQLIVPKEAVLDRQNRKVVFVMEDGIAKWNYVDIAFENSNEYALESGIKEGDRVIYEGNFNLAHDKPVLETD